MKNLAEVAENFSSKITQLRGGNMALHRVILDCDWFVLGAKQFAFLDALSLMLLQYVFFYFQNAITLCSVF